ncbi:MAG: CHAT domain-containing protein [Caldilinea sp. CFX5]|nr:CHAT domain-containing protein [Caldilinea sp. CFX5]
MEQTTAMPLLDCLALLAAYQNEPQALPSLLGQALPVQALLEEARRLIYQQINENHGRSAEQILQLALAIADVTQTAEDLAAAQWCQGIFYFNRDYLQAISSLEAACQHYVQSAQSEKEGRVLIGLAAQYLLLGRLEEAEARIQRASICLADYPDHPQLPSLYINYSHILTYLGQYSAAAQIAQKAVAQLEEFCRQQPTQRVNFQLLRGHALINQGNAAFFNGQWRAAEEAMRSALTLAGTHGFHEVAGRAALNLARQSILLDDLYAGFNFLQTAADNFTKTPFELNLATVALERARLYERLCMASSGITEALAAAQRYALASLATEAFDAYLLAVRLALAIDKVDFAQTLLATAHPFYKNATTQQQARFQVYAGHPKLQQTVAARRQAFAAVEEAIIRHQQFDLPAETLEARLIAAQLAAQLRQPQANQRLQAIVEEARQQGMGAIEQEALLTLAHRQRAARAIPFLRQAADVGARLRTLMPVEELKANLFSGHATLYRDLIEAQHQSHHFANAAATLLEAKGGIWVDLWASATTQAISPTWVQLKAELSLWRDALHMADTPAMKQRCQRKLEALEIQITTAARLQSRRREPQSLPTIADLQERLGEIPVLDFFVGSTNVWCCLFKQGAAPRWVSLCKVDAVTQWLNLLRLLLAPIQSAATAEQRQTVARKQLASAEQLLTELRALLLAPLVPYLPTTGPLYLAPDSQLFALPWSALFVGLADTDLTISLIPSAATLALAVQQSSPHQANAQPAFALGYAGEPPLHFIDAELTAIRTAFPTVTIINPATVAAMDAIRSPRFLHIAAHAHSDPNRPLLSAIELADGQFLLADLLRLQLRGSLVVLSACDTVTMPEQGGVALALAGACLIAGAQTVASLWPVDDEATCLLMGCFYRALRAGHPVAQALKIAQAEVRNHGYLHPYYYAAFQYYTTSLPSNATTQCFSA